MDRTEAVSLGDLLRQAIEENREAFRFDEIESVNAWPIVVGAVVASKTMKPYIKNGVMTIKVPSAPLRHELSMMRGMLAKALNAHTGKDTVKDIRFIG